MLLLLLPADLPFDIELQVLAAETSLPSLLDVSSFLYDLNLGYELSRLAADSRYESFKITPYALYRNGRPLKNRDRFQVEHLSHSSPIELQGLLWGAPLAIGSVWGLVQIVEKISNWRLDRQKTELEIRKLAIENQRASRGGVSTNASSDLRRKRVQIYTEEEYSIVIHHRDEMHLIDGVTKRLEKSKVQISEMNIRFVRRTREIPEDE